MKNFRLILAGIGLPLLLAGCLGEEAKDLPSGTVDGMTVNNEESELGERVTDHNDTIALDTVQVGAKRAASTKTLVLTLIAEIAPPVVGGKTLQASSVVLKADYAYVSYNYQGEQYLGGVDVVQIKSGKNAEIRSGVTFNDADVHSVYFDGNDLFMAGATSNAAFAAPAVLERVGLNGGKLVLAEKRERVALNSFAATAVTVSGKQVYATSGNTGGLHVLSLDALAPQSVKTLGDARWLDYNDASIVVAQGMPGRLTVYNKSTLAVANTWSFAGADMAEAKTTVRVLGNKALVAAGTGGVKLMSIATGKVVGSVPVPVVTGVSAALSVANAADGREDLIYVSNGEAGVYAVQASTNIEKAAGEDNITLSVLGKLQFTGAQSVNHVAFDGNTLVVAAGAGGTKIVSVKWE